MRGGGELTQDREGTFGQRRARCDGCRTRTLVRTRVNQLCQLSPTRRRTTTPPAAHSLHSAATMSLTELQSLLCLVPALVMATACGGARGSERPVAPVPDRSPPAEITNAVPSVEVDASAALPEMIAAIAAADWGGAVDGDDCAFLWGVIDVGPGLAPLRVAAEGGGPAISGLIACDDEVIESALPQPSGVIMAWRGDDLVMAHASDVGDGVDFDAAYREAATADPRVRASYVVVAISGAESTSAATALEGFAQITQVFGAAMLGVGPRTSPHDGNR